MKMKKSHLKVLDAEAIACQAQEELDIEIFRKAVEQEKKRLMEKKSLWDRVFPWRIKIERKDSK